MRQRDRMTVVVGAATLVILSNGPVLVGVRRLFDAGAGFEHPLVRPWFVGAALIGVVLAVWSYRSGTRLVPGQRLVGMLVTAWLGIAFVTAWFGLRPRLALSRLLVYVGISALGWALGRLPLRVLRDVVLVFVTAALVASVVVIVVSPHVGVDPRDGSWRGLYTGRNSLAPVAALGVVTGFWELSSRSRARIVLGLALLGVAAVVLVGTGNRTDVIAAGAALGLPTAMTMVLRLARDRGREAALVGGAAFGVAGVAAMAVTVDAALSTSTLELRRRIWGETLTLIAQRPLSGWGLGMVWEDPVTVSPIYERLGVAFGSAHDVVLEIWLGMGLAGVVVYVALLVVAMTGALVGYRRSLDADDGWLLGLIVLIVVTGLTESFILWFSYQWTLTVAAALAAARSLTVGTDRPSSESSPAEEPLQAA